MSKIEDVVSMKSVYANFVELKSAFEKVLGIIVTEMTVQSVRAGITTYGSSALQVFRQTYKEMMGGFGFHTEAGNLIPIIQKPVHREAFTERFGYVGLHQPGKPYQ